MESDNVLRRNWTRAGSKALIALAAVAGWVMPMPVAAQEAVGLLNVPITATGDITPGMNQLEIEFTVDDAAGFVAEVVVPVTGATFTLLDPSGTVVLAPGSAGVNFVAGADLAPQAPLPGGVFHTDELGTPADGDWTIRLNFPTPPTVPTVAVATIMVRTSLQAGMVLPRQNYIVGETATLGFLVLDGGVPVTNLTPTLEVIRLAPGATTFTIAGSDNGTDPDGSANDGLYSASYLLTQAGTYRVSASVDIPSSSGPIRRAGETTLTVSPAPLSIGQVTARLALGSGGCTRGMEQVVALDVTDPGEYVVAGVMRSASGRTMETRRRFNLGAGSQTVVLLHAANKIRDKLQQDGPYDLTVLDVLRASDLSLAGQMHHLGASPALSLASLCRAPLEIGDDLVVTNRLRDGYIDALDFALTVTTQVAGNYQLSFKVVGPAGQDIQLIGLTRTLQVGANQVTFSVPATRLQTVDGPYSVISGIAVGPAGSAQRAQVGATGPLQRWQHYPTRVGDLDGDGDVDAADRSLLASFARNIPALQPGDRRDIARDGRIDIRDVRAIQNLP